MSSLPLSEIETALTKSNISSTRIITMRWPPVIAFQDVNTIGFENKLKKPSLLPLLPPLPPFLPLLPLTHAHPNANSPLSPYPPLSPMFIYSQTLQLNFKIRIFLKIIFSIIFSFVILGSFSCQNACFVMQ